MSLKASLLLGPVHYPVREKTRELALGMGMVKRFCCGI